MGVTSGGYRGRCRCVDNAGLGLLIEVYHRLGRRDDGLQPGAAQPVHVERGRLLRHAGADRTDAAQVRIARLGRNDVAHDDVFDALGTDAGAFDRRLDSRGTQITEGHILERAAFQIAHDDIWRLVRAIVIVYGQQMGMLKAGDQAAGPAILEEDYFTCRVLDGWSFVISDAGDIMLNRKG